VQGGYAGTGNISGNPLLTPLGNYGGASQTMALLPGSAAIDTGDACSTTDQRGLVRVGSCDIGAFESQGFTLFKTGGDGQSAVIGSPFGLPLALSVTAHNPAEPVDDGVVLFTAPFSGPSLNSGLLITTIADGAVSRSVTANSTAGGPYGVIASAAGATGGIVAFITPAAVSGNVPGNASGVTFWLTNLLPPSSALTVTIIGNGSVTSTNTVGINYTCSGGTCDPMVFPPGDTVTLTATGSNSTFSAWSGGYAGTDNPGSITLDGDKAVTATFTADQAKVRIDGDATLYYALGSTLNAVARDATIRARDVTFGETVTLTNSHNLKLRGGFTDTGFTDSGQSGYSTISAVTGARHASAATINSSGL